MPGKIVISEDEGGYSVAIHGLTKEEALAMASQILKPDGRRRPRPDRTGPEVGTLKEMEALAQ